MVIVRTRFTAAALVVSTTALLGTSLLAAGPARAVAPRPQVGLFGSQDPTYDGAFRQSLALLAFVAADRTPPPAAVDWLLAQQCSDGGFQAFRSDTAARCTPSDPAAYTGEDTNSTGLAAAALRAIGRTAAADRAVTWLTGAQNTDGGFPYFVKGDSDANSTAIVLLATNAAGRTPASVQRGGVSAADFLATLQIGCDGAATDDDGSFAFQDYGTGLVDNDSASAQATFALSGAALPLAPRTVSTDVPRASCPAPATTPGTGAAPGTASSTTAAATASPAATATAVTGAPSAADLGAGHLARLLDTYGGAVPQLDYSTGKRLPGSVSAGDTAWAALSLAAVGVGRTQLDAALATLSKATGIPAVASRVRPASAATDQPGLLGVVALAIHAAGGSASAVDTAVTRIGATMRTAPATASPSPTSASPSASTPATPATGGNAATLAQTGGSPVTPLLAGVGGALVLLGLLGVVGTRRRGTHA